MVDLRGGRKKERERERGSYRVPPQLPPPPTHPTISTAAAKQKQEPSNQSNSPQRLVQSAQVLTQKLITSPSLTIDGTKLCMELSEDVHVERRMLECESPLHPSPILRTC